jgi:hypothetical protein
MAFLTLPLPTLFALAMALVSPRLAAQAVSALALLQTAVLLAAEAIGLELLALWAALVLVLVAVAGGGLPAVVAPTGFLALAGAFFALDHALRRIAAWPNVPPPPLGLVLRDAARTVAAPVLLLAAALVAWPTPPLSAGTDGPMESLALPEVRRAYQWLALVALAGMGTLTLVFRWLRSGGSDTPPLVEMEETHVEAEEPLEPPSIDDARYLPARTRVIRAYLRFLWRARRAGFRLEPHLTPREIEGHVRRPTEPLGLLTGLFMDARYGPDEPTPDAVHHAEAASRAICAGLSLGGALRRAPPLTPPLRSRE